MTELVLQYRRWVVWVCEGCGVVKADEDGCCVTCGAICSEELASLAITVDSPDQRRDCTTCGGSGIVGSTDELGGVSTNSYCPDCHSLSVLLEAETKSQHRLLYEQYSEMCDARNSVVAKGIEVETALEATQAEVHGLMVAAEDLAARFHNGQAKVVQLVEILELFRQAHGLKDNMHGYPDCACSTCKIADTALAPSLVLQPCNCLEQTTKGHDPACPHYPATDVIDWVLCTNDQFTCPIKVDHDHP